MRRQGANRVISVALSALVLGACAEQERGTDAPHNPEVTREGAEAGRGFYAVYCTSCHGAQATGDGPMAGDLPVPPSDLTQLSNRYGAFPWSRVMAQVHGYHGRNDVMPEYQTVLEGPKVMWRDETGARVETPLVLVQVAQYLAAIQD
jgi:mono/diheme cytochrome c family protein